MRGQFYGYACPICGLEYTAECEHGLREIVDYQAEMIAEQAAEIERLRRAVLQVAVRAKSEELPDEYNRWTREERLAHILNIVESIARAAREREVEG